MTRIASSPYLEWAKLQSAAPWNLATSGVHPATLADIGGLPDSMPLTGPNAYGYAPLLERIAAHYLVHPSQVVTATGCSMANFLALAALFTLWLAGWSRRLLPSAVHWRPAPYISLLERPG